MRILALDLSSKSTGWAIFDNNNLIQYGCIIQNSTDSLLRIINITKEIENIYLQYKPDKIVCEDIIPSEVGHNQQVFKVLHYLQAAVVLMLHNYKQTVEFYVSSEWRKKCGIKTGRGITRDMVKQADIKFVKDKYNLDVNDDIADAIGIGYAYLNPPIPVSTASAVKKSAF